MSESQLAKEWTADARKEGIKEGRNEGQALLLLDIMESKYGAIPQDLTERVRHSTDTSSFKRWSKVVLAADSLADFRRETQL